MLNNIYELEKLRLKNEKINTIDSMLDFDEFKIKKVDHVILIEFNITDKEIFEFKRIITKEYSDSDSINYLFKKGHSTGTHFSPSTFIKTKNPDNDFNKRFISWFKNKKGENEIINKIYNVLEENKEDILNQIINKCKIFRDKNKKEKNTFLSIRFKENGEYKYLYDFKIIDENNQEKYIFRDFLLQDRIKKFYNISKKSSRGISSCYLCGETKEVYGYVPNGIGLYFGTPDKIGNTPNFKKENQWKQSSICENCALELEDGFKFIKEYLSFNEFGCGSKDLTYYLIPEYTFNKEEVFKKTYDDLKRMKDKKYSGIIEIEDGFFDNIKNLDNSLKFNFLYYKEKNKSFRILDYIENIPLSWLKEIYNSQQRIKKLKIFDKEHMQILFNDNNFSEDFILVLSKNNKEYQINENNWYPGLLRYFTLPENSEFKGKNKKDKNQQGLNNKFYLEIINSVMTNININYDLLLKYIMDKIRLSWKDNKKYISMKYDILKSLHLLMFFDNLNLFGKENKFNLNTTDKKSIYSILNSYNRKVCFLLGVLTKRLTSQQYKRLNSKSFLNNLDGLNLTHEKIQILYKKVIKKLFEYNVFYSDICDLLSYNLLESENNWNLNRDETNYYFILGYIYGDIFKLDIEKQKEEDQEKKKREDIK